MRIASIFLILITSLATASFTTAFMLFNARNLQPQAVRIKDVSTGKDTLAGDALRAQIFQIGVRLDGLEKRVSSINEEIALLQKSQGTAPTVSHNPAPAAEPVANNSAGSTVKQAAASAPRPAPRVNSRQGYLQREFIKEERDPKWSSKAMVTLMATLSKDVLRDSELTGMDCRATFCVVRIKHPDKEKAESFVQRFGIALNWIQSRIEVFFTGIAEDHTEMYIFKSEKF